VKLLTLTALSVSGLGLLYAQQVKKSGKAPQQGQKIFAASCAACHGLDGRGGERAPNIAGSTRLQHLPDAGLSTIVRNGVPGTGMPAFASFTPAEIHAVVAHLRVLQGQGKTQPLPGDAARGKELFFGRAECSSCHMVRGQGGFLGPDLSTYGISRNPNEILAAITSTERDNDWGYKPAKVVLSDGSAISGIVRNEDNFSVQLQTSGGVFHFLQKSELQSMKYGDRPVMPTDYRDKFSHADLENLVSYLISAGQGQRKVPDAPQEDPIEEQ